MVYYQRDRNPVFTISQRDERIRERYAQGEALSNLAREYSISPQRVFQIVNFNQGQSIGAFLFTTNAGRPTQNKLVRQAINYAIDKDTIVKNIYKGYTKPTGQLLQETTVGYNPAIKPYPYDPAKAKQLLAEAGYPNGFETTIYSYAREDVPELPRLVEAIAGLADSVVGHGAEKYVPLLSSFFIFILVSNAFGLLPGFTPPTSDFNITFALGVVSFVAFNYWGFKAQGIGYLKHFAGPILWRTLTRHRHAVQLPPPPAYR